MNIYTITGATKDEFLINAKNIISTSMNGVLSFANEDESNLWFNIIGSANYLRIEVSGTDPSYYVAVELTNSSGSYIDRFATTSNQLLHFIKFSGGEVGITNSLSSSITSFLNLRLHNLTTGTDYIGYMASDDFYINDIRRNITMLITRSTPDSLAVRPPIFFPYLFKTTSNGHEWMWKNVLGTFVDFGVLKKMLYNGSYWRQIESGEICYYIKDGE